METKLGRWANWELAVLGKCGDLDTLLAENDRRRLEIDCDSEESGLVREAIVTYLRQRGEDPNKAHVFMKMDEVRSCVSKFSGGAFPLNKVKSFVNKQNIAELRHKRLSSGAGFVWRGRKATRQKPRRVGCRMQE